MAVRVNKSSFNIREKLSELGRKFGLKGSELAAAETVQEARDLVSAGRKNLIHNGDFRVDQRGGPHITQNNYHLDRWKFQKDGLAEYTHSVTSSTDAPNGFSKSLRLEVTATETSGVSSTEDLALTQEMEGQDLQLLAAGTKSAKPFTLSFWVKSTKPGVYCVSIVADPNTGNKIFSTTYTINSASVWEYKVIKVPACTLTTITNSSGRGMSVRWITLAGSAYTTASGGNLHEWDDYHSSLFAGGHQTQLITDGDVWQITGVQLEVGKNATEFEHRTYGEELALCQRYFFKSLATRQSILYKGPLWETNWYHFPVEMRANPNVSGGSWFLRNPGSNANISYSGFSYTIYRTGFYITSNTTNTNTFQCWFNDAPLTASAEL